MEKKELGNRGEDMVEQYLLQQNYQIVHRNFRCRQGEIDMIAKDQKEWVFIEVKTRTNTQYGRPAQAVDYYKKKHIYQVASFYIYSRKLETKWIRFDVIEVFMKGGKTHIHHIKSIPIM